jgi:hypothetical protein
MSILRRDTYANNDQPIWTPNSCVANAMSGFGNTIALPEVTDGTRVKIATINPSLYNMEVGATYEMVIGFELSPVADDTPAGGLICGLGYYSTYDDDYTIKSLASGYVNNTWGNLSACVSLTFTWLGGVDDGVDILVKNQSGANIVGGDLFIYSFMMRKQATPGIVRNIISVLD